MALSDKQPWPPGDTLTAIADIIFVMLDRQATILNINHYGCELLEYPTNELIGKSWLDYCIPMAQQASVRRVFQQIIRGELQAEHYRNPVLSRSGKEYVLAWHNMVRYDPQGQIIGTLSSGIDITEHLEKERQSLETLETAEARTRAILDNAIEGIIGSDTHGNIISFNKAAEKIFGYHSEEILGHNVNLLMPLPQQQPQDSHISHYLASNEKKIIGVGQELMARKKDGSLFPIHLAVTDYIVNGKRLFTRLVRDLSEQKAAEQQLKEKEEEIRHSRERLAHIARVTTLGEITTGIAHEVNQPLTAIATYAQSAYRLAHMETDDEDELGYVLEQIERQAMRASQVIQGLRNLTKQGDSTRDTCHINNIIEDTLALVTTEAAANRVSLHCQLSPDLPAVDVDAVQIQQVLINLILNAIQAMENTDKSQRFITLSSTLNADNQVQVSVSDTGSGISKDYQNQLFTPFFTTKRNGMGIGLSICRTLITAHGGSLNINRNKRKGSEFFFVLPTANT